MGLKFKKGDDVTQVITPITGKVSGVILIDDEVQFLVSWTDANGDAHERPFKEDDLQADASVSSTAP